MLRKILLRFIEIKLPDDFTAAENVIIGRLKKLEMEWRMSFEIKPASNMPMTPYFRLSEISRFKLEKWSFR